MNNFEKVSVIGRGSYGKAMLVKSKRDKRLLVIKEINISEMSTKEKKEAENEISVLAQLKHPNIIETVDIVCDHGHYYEVSIAF